MPVKAESREPSEFGDFLFELMEDRGFETLEYLTSEAHSAGFYRVREKALRGAVYDNELDQMVRQDWGSALSHVLDMSEEQKERLARIFLNTWKHTWICGT
jgi:hypothetical protein